MISKNECMQVILEKFPTFMGMWQEHLKWWGDETPGLSNDIAVFSEYALDLLQEGKCTSEINDIFLFIETLLVDGSDDVKDAVATCFLENLINATSCGTISASSFVHLLGNESKNYCKAWDEFTDIKTNGLWTKQDK